MKYSHVYQDLLRTIDQEHQRAEKDLRDNLKQQAHFTGGNTEAQKQALGNLWTRSAYTSPSSYLHLLFPLFDKNATTLILSHRGKR